MPMIKANGANFYYELYGKGKPLILIAGYTCDYTSWQLMIDDLSKYFQVLVFDNRGVGQTTDNQDVLSAELMAEDVIALAEQLQLEKPHIVGQSMGGTIAQTVAVNFPDKISKLGLVTTSSKWRQAMLCGLNSLLMMRQKNIDFDTIFEATLPWIFGERFLSNKQTIAEFKKILLDNPHPQSLNDQARQFTVLKNFDLREKIKNIKSATLIIHGVEDLISLPYELKYMESQIPNCQILEFDCAHGITLEAPPHLSEALIKFLK